MLTAYLDAGSGSLIATAVVGGAAGAAVALRSMSARITGVFSRKKRSDTEPEQGDTAEPTEAVAPDQAQANVDA